MSTSEGVVAEVVVGADGKALLVVWRVPPEKGGKLVVFRPGTKVVADISGAQLRLRELIRGAAGRGG